MLKLSIGQVKIKLTIFQDWALGASSFVLLRASSFFSTKNLTQVSRSH